MSLIADTSEQLKRRASTRTNGLSSLPLHHVVEKLYEMAKKPPAHWSDLPAYIDAIKHQRTIGIDDRLMLLEKLLVTMSLLDEQEPDLSKEIQEFVISTLYKDLPHPPSGFLTSAPSILSISSATDHRSYEYRPTDGSNYNPLAPTLGKVGHPYARSVPSTICVPDWALPDASLVFDTLLKREKFVPHPGGISSLFFAFADLVIHDIFNTSPDGLRNNTSSYLDLSILYGTSDAQVDSIRQKDGTGRLWPDVFADSRLLHMPPASCALLVLLSRNHNYIAQRILDINEQGNYQNPPPKDAELLQAQDDEIFNRARLVNCGHFVHIILGDYVGSILGLVRDGSPWRLDPLMPMREIDHGFAPRGEGNVVSIEFNFLYRWHSTLSLKDTEWTEGMVKRVFGDTDPGVATAQDFHRIARKLAPNVDVRKWEFGNLKRMPSGLFKDSDLAQLIHNATEWRAGSFKARGIPEALRVVEIMTIEQARRWGTCTLNEFRKFLGLKPYSSFKEWNPDKEIYTAAAALYKDIDNLELHVGLQAEEAKEPGPGAGLCPGYTISRAILSDAVCLTRGDRFYTVDFTPSNLTSWGYIDCQYDKKDGSYGGLLTKLLYRTLPDYFPSGSAYAHFPFMDPVWMEEDMNKKHKDLVQQYTWTRPRSIIPSITISSHGEVKRILSDPAFASNSDDRLYSLMKSLSPKQAKTELSDVSHITSKNIFERRADEYFTKRTRDLIEEKSLKCFERPTKQVDIIKDVINLLPVYWLSDTNILQLPLIPKAMSDDAMTDTQVADEFAAVGRYVYMNGDPANDWHLRMIARKFAGIVINLNNGHEGYAQRMTSFLSSKVHGSLRDRRKSSKDLDSNEQPTVKEHGSQVFAAAVPTAPYFSKALANVVDYYLSADKSKEREDIVRLANEGDFTGVMIYVKEALRMHPIIAGFYRTALQDVIIGDGKVESAQRVYVDIAAANRDVSHGTYIRNIFPELYLTFVTNSLPCFMRATPPLPIHQLLLVLRILDSSLRSSLKALSPLC
ncbi:hypothetical protein AX17_004331 [Amanita inopinata Kibby_2008]|nr:hypothetical protein AX17_004331 [Amanita inopinata Kibby_2008]